MAAFVALVPATAGAQDSAPPSLDPIEAPGNPAHAPALAREQGAVDAKVPLTRAAARQRIETMSPTDWLAGYGPVVVGRTAPTATADR